MYNTWYYTALLEYIVSHILKEIMKKENIVHSFLYFHKVKNKRTVID